MKRLLKVDRLSWKLGLSIAALVICGQAAGFFLAYRHYYGHVLEGARQHAATETALMRRALEFQMLEKDDRLLREMVQDYARDKDVERVMILDREGEVRISSDPGIRNHHFDQNDPTCRVCHEAAPEDRARSTMLEIDGGQVLRVAQPIPNREICFACHNPDHKINGLILVDIPLGRTISELEQSTMALALATTAIALVLLSAIGLVFRRLVLRRLFRFEGTARAIAHGDLERRVPVEGNDALTRVEDQFNLMADAVTELLTQLRLQRANLEKVMNSVDDGMVVLDRQRNIVAANDGFSRRFTAAQDELIGRSCCLDLSEGGIGCSCEGACPTQLCFSSEQVQTVIRKRTDPDAGERIEEVRASPVYDDDGQVSYVVEVWRDITDRRSAEAQLAEYQRLVSLGMLASGFSHEVNTPLASIATCLDGIKRSCSDTEALEGEDLEQVTEYARIAATQVQRCGTITQQFLSLARGKTLSRDAVSLPTTAETVVRLSKHIAKEAGVTLEVVPDEALQGVIANEASVQQVLLNLVLNAIEASSRGHKVTLSFRVGERIEVLVSDQGKGIAPADLQRVFEPFFSKRERGTGLGLFVSLNLARGWGGDILVESTLGSGTTFAVAFPLPGEALDDDGA